MKKVAIVLVLLVLLIAGGAWYMLSGAGDFIRTQIEQQGTKFLGTQVTVASAELALSEGRLTISAIKVNNPKGFSSNNAFSLGAVTLDLGDSMKEPYVVQNVSVNSPAILYEVDASGKGNLLVLKDNLAANLPKGDTKPTTEEGANPLMIVENVTISDVRLTLNFENLPTGDLAIETKEYEITLPTFNAGSIGKPNGLPADQVGAAIMDKMLDNVIAQAKAEGKKRLAEEAKRKLAEKIDKEKDELVDKAKNKVKDFFDRD